MCGPLQRSVSQCPSCSLGVRNGILEKTNAAEIPLANSVIHEVGLFGHIVLIYLNLTVF